MFSEYSFVNTVGEYGFDCLNRRDILLREEICKNVITINTQYGSVVVTPDTLIVTGRGLWKRAEELVVGDSLKHYTMNRAVITGITNNTNDPQYMLKVIDCTCGYLVVDGMYIASDV